MRVELVDYMGSDLSVVNAARVSFDKESEWEYKADEEIRDGKLYFVNHSSHLSERDTKLINYLAKHNHWTPFGHAFASFRIKAPIFVARQLGKHQVGLVWNEVSRRYVDSEPEFYVPDVWRKRAENVKQGSSDEEVVQLRDLGFRSQPVDEAVTRLNGHALSLYEDMLSVGICPEQARMVLPQSMYTEWVWSGSLAAFARVCKLRLDPHTQRETQYVAMLIAKEAKTLFPVSWGALMETEES